ncbi:L-glutamine:scyllo-inosose aminotransferase [Maioricimonas rarisocia]|uniref:L-glutamine:scyllo-inosose aminotransferase n=1 Tax=Maioricimonas rarisocia TaxID=2528026 RepID=A0A517YZZ5_9PLAN|nr:aminotransferase class V-fold PLP-dependent enzyme [Maioricimonas rarisocia]QDU35753.1 L-glutamine:scyllo-inosose aminotransferase [Maioricimonas rarisocia]
MEQLPDNIDSPPAILGGPSIRPEGPPAWPLRDPAIEAVLQDLIRTGDWGRYHGSHCQQLAEALAAYHGIEHVELCASGTAAIELALRGLHVSPGSEVILAGYDFKGNFVDVLTMGAVPVLVDIRPDDWQVDVSRIEAAINGSTQAVLVSHLHGGIVDMPRLRELADHHGLPIIEDACQMPGATVHGRRAGLWGDAAVLSFGGSKLLSAGRGGAVLTSRADIAQRIRLYTQRGNAAYPLSEMQAAILVPQLEQLDERNAQRAENAASLIDRLVDVAGLTPLVSTGSDNAPGYYKLGLQYDPDAFASLSRDRFAEAMRAEGIALDPGFRALHAIHSRRRFRAADPLAEASRADDSVLTLHHPVLLGDDGDIRQIVTAIERIRQHAAAIVAAT